MNGVPRRAQAGKFTVDAVALQHVALRLRFAGDLVGDGALDDRPGDAARAGLLLDILEAAIDDRIDRIELDLDPLRAVAPAAALSAVAAVAPTGPPVTVSAAITVARTASGTGAAIAALTRFLGGRGAALGSRRPIAARPAVAASRRPTVPVVIGSRRRTALGGACRGGSSVIAGAAKLRRPATPSASPQWLAVGADAGCRRSGTSLGRRFRFAARRDPRFTGRCSGWFAACRDGRLSRWPAPAARSGT